MTEATGIKAVVKAVAGDDCGCKERKEKLNRLFPYHSSLRMTEEQKAVWNNVIDPDYKRGRLQRTSKVALEKMYKDMGAPVKIGGCPSCARKALKRMEAIYQASCETS